MSKVLLGDVAVEHKETCKGSKDGYPIVGRNIWSRKKSL